jgi:hypothetical protein
MGNKKIIKLLINLISRSRFFLLYLFVIFFEVNKLGLQIKEKIEITSSLDFSWFIDSIQRLSQGYILGKDFIFTYGPIFQLVYSLPGIVLKLPSHVTFLLNPLVSTTLIYLLLLLFVKLLEKDRSEQFLIFIYLIFFVSLISYSSLDLIKALTPLVFVIFWQKCVVNNQSRIYLILFPLFPTIAGAFSYDLFIYCLIIAFALSCLKSLKEKSLNYIFPIILIILYQFLFSFVISGSLNYIIYSVDTIKNYSEMLNSFWTFDRSNFLYIFPLILIILVLYYLKNAKEVSGLKNSFLFLAITSLIFLQTGIIRSDYGHIVRSIYPSIITTFLLLYYLAKKNKKFIILLLMLFLFIPNKTEYTFSLSGIKTVMNVLKSKPQFNQLYKFSANYYLTNLEINNLSNFIQENKKDVLVYPFDNYLLDINNTSYNSFPLQYYQYSNSIVEQKGVSILSKNPPRYIIYMVDQKGALDLDNIPNLTRNSLFSKWVLSNYLPFKTTGKYLILKFTKNKKEVKLGKECSLYDIEFINFNFKTFSLFKNPVYFLNSYRIPKANKNQTYLFFDGFNSSSKLAKLFKENINFNNFYFSNKPFKITRYSAFFKKAASLEVNNKNLKVYCYN